MKQTSVATYGPYAEPNGTFRMVLVRGRKRIARSFDSEADAVRAMESARSGHLPTVVCPSRCSVGGFVYFLVEGAARPRIKIGKSVDIASRLERLQVGTAHRLRLVGFYWAPDVAEEEADLHAKYEAQHIRGEWFRPSPGLLNAIRIAREAYD